MVSFIRMGRECGWKPIIDTNVDTVDTKTDTIMTPKMLNMVS